MRGTRSFRRYPSRAMRPVCVSEVTPRIESSSARSPGGMPDAPPGQTLASWVAPPVQLPTTAAETWAAAAHIRAVLRRPATSPVAGRSAAHNACPDSTSQKEAPA